MKANITVGLLWATISRRSALSFASGLVVAILAWSIGSVSTWAGSASKHSFAFNIENGRITGPKRTVRVKEGDFVELLWRADSNVELHLHGYDLHLHLKPGELRTISFQAHTAGRYPLSTHGSSGHGALIYLEIYPQ